MKTDSSYPRVRSPLGFSLGEWKSIAVHLFKQIGSDNLTLISAGVAFYFLLAIFPMMAALVSVYGLFVDPQQLSDQLTKLAFVLPQESREILFTHLTKIVSEPQSTLSIGVVISLGFSLWSASKGAQALVTACNITYKESEKRVLWKALIVRMVLTGAAVMLMVASLLLIAVVPVVFSLVGLSDTFEQVVPVVSWGLLALCFNFALAALYRYAPHRTSPKWRWVSFGSLLATLLWGIASYGFSIYVKDFAQYNETYGSLGGVIILLMWLYFTALIILLGAECNSVIEHHTVSDSTQGNTKPVGERGAVVADTLPSDKS
ncbi:YihY/virulence factor BrkB family protein [Aestuariibacter sp. AA17]|uniref:YihY/virulence factor BrkB family protein n=1 Tax=Fluctibacter corallii TaxID=2984329 RepID=A0ABT3A788_9ALTE|nr:YihY/virulence factor BrkB family protein [Aestuariibacter sp. AA17]MCV2884528.1 YihY/virulence factor BrkB family protein [Aestuariibacter sp. AA17]